MSREQNELIGEFKIATDDVIGMGGGYEIHVHSGIRRELVRFGVDCERRSKLRDCWRRKGGIHSSGHNIFSDT